MNTIIPPVKFPRKDLLSPYSESDVPIRVAIALLIGIIFILDIGSPTRFVFWTLYVFPLFLTVYVGYRRAHVVVGGVIIVLVLAGIVLGSQNVQMVNTVVNRTFFSATIAILAYFIGRYRDGVTELRESRENLIKSEENLKHREADLRQSLREKEVLLSEVHHRVKNNLTAFISLLSLEGSSRDSPADLALKKDLQNRARSMALIHETLYNTRQYAEVDMKEYLSALVDQVVNSYRSSPSVRTSVDAEGITLDLARATPAGLIINELVANSLKYAFPNGAVGSRNDGAEPAIGILITKDGGEYLMRVSDNGIGLPAGLDIATAPSLGLKLVNFLAKHQLKAKVEVSRENGTEFVFRFRE